jgi:hypothetical protein
VLAMQIFLCWVLFIWLDVSFFDGRILGPTAMRWRLDLVVRLVILILTSVLVGVFWWDRWNASTPQTRIDTATLISVAMGGVRD